MRAQLEKNISCVKCGYSLRGLHFRGACPECGCEIGQSVLEADPELAVQLDEQSAREQYDAQTAECERQQQETARLTEEWSRQLRVRESLLSREEQLVARTERLLIVWEQLSQRIDTMMARFESKGG